MFATIHFHDVLILAGVILVNCPVFVPSIARCYFPNTKFGKWVDDTPLIIQVPIYWAVGGVLLYLGFDEMGRYQKEHPPFVPYR
jgi:hypothetical protein